jgi:excisionase family DNA binding protein
MEQITFENLPKAVTILANEISEIKRLLLSKDKEQLVNTSDQPFTVHEAAEFLSLAVPTIYTMVSRGELPVMKRSKRLYFSRNELMDYLKQGKKKTISEIESETDAYLAKKKGGIA